MYDFASRDGYAVFAEGLYDDYFGDVIKREHRDQFVLYFFADSSTMMSYVKGCVYDAIPRDESLSG